MDDLHQAQAQEAAHNDLHAAAQGGCPQHWDGEQGEEVVNEDIADHAEVSNGSAAILASVACSARASTQVHGKDGGDESPDDHDNNGNNQDDLALQAAGKAVEDQGNSNLDKSRGDVEAVLVGRIVLSEGIVRLIWPGEPGSR